ncbi:hypothetical protein [Leucothrix arctica]|nr:hypothetical protein [Leucothrix arctica]
MVPPAVKIPNHEMTTDLNLMPDAYGEFITRGNERFYAIRNVDQMPAFFISVVSNSDHWLFASSNGGITAGRVSPDSALFPYGPVDRIEDSAAHTGCKTILKVKQQHSAVVNWEPFNEEQTDKYELTRNLYKNTLGNKLCFEEVNHDLELVFRYTWMTSDEFGFVRHCELENLDRNVVDIDMVDGLQNLLAGATPREVQSSSSNLVNAYKWNELDLKSGIGSFTLYSGISDRAAPAESMWANTVFSIGLDKPTVLLSSKQLAAFRKGHTLKPETCIRGLRGAYLVNSSFKLDASSAKEWQLIANVEQTQTQVVALRQKVVQEKKIELAIEQSVAEGSEDLIKIIAAVDGFQLTAEENVSVHHYANVLFNSMRGGVFDQQYKIDKADFMGMLSHFNSSVYEKNRAQLENSPASMELSDFIGTIQACKDLDLERLAYEYLPITFGRRHGDPSRPWNEFAIKLKDEHGDPLLSYQGNWRDIFQNWEALLFSYPEFVENIIAKFVNASTVDGYNPYRITKQGIDWEVQEEGNPWSYIGYWGDHQIIYLLKLLELSSNFHPGKLNQLLRHPIYCYANVPYRIKPFASMCENPKDTVDYDFELSATIDQRVSTIGADGKLLLDQDDKVYQVNLLEKLLIPILCKLSNLVPDGGIWLNAQRPEWNDANNALVGHGLSMVTLNYLRRHICFLQNILESEQASFELSNEVAVWLTETTDIFGTIASNYKQGELTQERRFSVFEALQQSSDQYRSAVYQRGFTGKTEQTMESVKQLFANALEVIDTSIEHNKREDGLYHAYNLLNLKDGSLGVDYLYPMLEGQVAALSSGALPLDEAAGMLESLFETSLYRADQHTFILYPDRDLPGFFEKNSISQQTIDTYPALSKLFALGESSILEKDVEGKYHFNAALTNKEDLDQAFNQLVMTHGDEYESLRSDVQALYETVFNHKAFTGRSGGMFGFEGLGSIYWHMVSKLLLAAQENYFEAKKQGADAALTQRLGQSYYRVREGIGFNKTPAEYGAFPTDPYSHTPKHAGAQQPGMTGQVKEEVLTRFGELGIHVNDGQIQIDTCLLREREFLTEPVTFNYIDSQGDNKSIDVPISGLAFTWCQIPFVYLLSDQKQAGITIEFADGTQQHLTELCLSAALSDEIFRHTGKVSRITFNVTSDLLFKG